MNPDSRGIQNIVQEVTGTAGAMAKVAFTSTVSGSWVSFFNGSTINNCYVKFVARGDSAPTVSATNAFMVIYPGAERFIPINTALFDLYVFSSGAAFTATSVTV